MQRRTEILPQWMGRLGRDGACRQEAAIKPILVYELKLITPSPFLFVIKMTSWKKKDIPYQTQKKMYTTCQNFRITMIDWKKKFLMLTQVAFIL